MLTTNLFYPIYIALGFILVVIFIPREKIKEYFIYGLLLGGLGDILVVGLFQNLLHIISFKNAGIFLFLGMNFLSPISWTVTVMLFLNFLPRRKPFLYLYVLTFATFSVGYGYLVHNVGLFDFKPWFYPVYSFLTFLGWWSFISWIYIKTSPANFLVKS